MARRSLLVLATAVLVAAQATSAPAGAGGQVFGEAPTLASATALADVLGAPERFGAHPILLEGDLVDVCQKKGCWTILREGQARIRVRFADYGFFIPKDSIGAHARVQGVVTVRTISEGEARHYEEEARDGDPDAIRGPQREVAFTASGLRLLRDEAE